MSRRTPRAVALTGQGIAAALAMLMVTSAAPAGVGASLSPDALRALAREHGAGTLVDNPPVVPAADAPTVVLGRALFFSTELSLDGDVSCATCHDPRLGGADARALPVGTAPVDADAVGPERTFDWQGAGHNDPHATPGPNVPRNSPTVFNTALYKRVLFHDGRLRFLPALGVFRSPESSRDGARDLLALQARLPVTSEREMRGFNQLRHAPRDTVRQAVLERLRTSAVQDWPGLFARAFGDPEPTAAAVTQTRLENALSDYQSALTFTDSPWMRFLRGDDAALDGPARTGARLFFTPGQAGGAGCAGCHAGDHFTDERFHVLATPQLGRGVTRPAGRFGNDTIADGSDFGREEATGRRVDRHAFRTPALTNATLTAPYGHAGAFPTLAGVIRHHFDPPASVAAFDFAAALRAMGSTLDPSRARSLTEAAVADWQRTGGERRAVSEEQVRALVAFIEALTDSCAARTECLAPWMPDPPS